jgi:4-hydroxy-tetrahydrodipicolinate synthase
MRIAAIERRRPGVTPAAPDLTRLAGSMVPVVTPFIGGDVDYDTFAALVRQQRNAGSHGVVVTGTSGEPSTLTVHERASLVEVAVDALAATIPVVAATGSQSLEETVELTQRAVAAGADAVLVVTPYYITPPQDGLIAYYEEVAGAAGELPVLIYHIPGRAGVTMEPDTVATLVQRSPSVVGMKHASTDIAYVASVLERLPDFRIFCGLEELGYPMLTLGAVGVMNAVGNVAPGAVADMCDKVSSGDLDGARRLHMQLLELNRAIFWETNPIPIKYLMRRLGLLARNEHRLPMLPASPRLEERLDDLLERTPWLTSVAVGGVP